MSGVNEAVRLMDFWHAKSPRRLLRRIHSALAAMLFDRHESPFYRLNALLAGEPSVLMRRELYVTPAALSSGLFVTLVLVRVEVWPAAAIAIAAGFALRGAAIERGWSLPAYRD